MKMVVPAYVFLSNIAAQWCPGRGRTSLVPFESYKIDTYRNDRSLDGKGPEQLYTYIASYDGPLSLFRLPLFLSDIQGSGTYRLSVASRGCGRGGPCCWLATQFTIVRKPGMKSGTSAKIRVYV